MSLIKKILNFFKLTPLEEETGENESVIPMLEQLNIENELEQLAKQVILEEEKKVDASKKTLLTRLYVLEQEIAMFKQDFKKEYEAFMNRIETLRQDYIATLEQLKSTLTFEIDPEIDGYMTGEVKKLEKDVKVFIEKEVKFGIISKRLECLILKLSILYNVSILHYKEYEKEKVLYRLEQALEVEKEIVSQLQASEYILNDKQLKERIINLFAYADYERFKTSIRNSKEQPEDIIKKLIIIEQFDKFDYITSFRAFFKEEISGFYEIIMHINENECKSSFEKRLDKILETITYDNNKKTKLLDVSFWNTFFSFETNLFQMIKASGIEVPVKPISTMNIGTTENEVLTLPITNVYVSLINLFSIKNDMRILLAIKLLKNISKEVTYKEMYFILVLFDVVEVIESIPNELIKYIKKYMDKYSYNREEILKKKQKVISSTNKEYILVFSLDDDYEQEIISTLEKLNIDFIIIDSNVYMNAFYFKGLNNVISSLQTNTQNII